MEGIRGVTPRRALLTGAQLGIARRKLQQRARTISPGWSLFIRDGKELGGLAEQALSWIASEETMLTDAELGGAVLGVMSFTADFARASIMDLLVDYLASTSGVAFVLRAALASLDTWTDRVWSDAKLVRRQRMNVWRRGGSDFGPFDIVRLHVASAVEYESLRAIAAEAPTDELTRAAVAFMFPTEGWADDAIRRGTAPPCLLTATSEDELVAKLLSSIPTNSFSAGTDIDPAGRIATILAMTGPTPTTMAALFGLLDRLTERPWIRSIAGVLACVATFEALLGLAARIEHRDIVPVLPAALERFPQLGVRALSSVASGRSRSAEIARQLLAATLRSDPSLLDALPSDSPARRTLVETQPTCDLAQVPAVLLDPPWLKPKAPTVAREKVPFEDAMSWPDGLQRAWALDPNGHKLVLRDGPIQARLYVLASLCLPDIALTAPSELIVEALAHRDFVSYAGIALLPLELALLILRSAPTKAVAQGFGDPIEDLGPLVVKAELAMKDIVLRLAEAYPAKFLGLLAPYRVADAAILVARALPKPRTRTLAQEWLWRHPDAAAAGLAPYLGASDVDRKLAAAALRFVATSGDQRVIERTTGAEVLRAAQAERRPAKIPKLPAFAGPKRLPAPIVGSGALPNEAVRNLLTLLAITALDPPEPEIAVVREACTPASLAAFAWELFAAWLVEGAPPKEAWAMRALGHFGDDAAARQLAVRIREWPEQAAHARAVAGLDVLAAIGTDVALMHLHGIAQRVKFRGLQQQARDKIDRLAKQRGLTVEELEDRLVPDLGLDQDGTLRLDFGPRAFTVTFDERLQPVVYQDHRRLDALPKPTKSDDATLAKDAVLRLQTLRKDARTIATQQMRRLELAMCTRRRWPVPVFETFLQHHPLLRHLVRRLVWGIYGANRPATWLRVAEDGTLTDAEDVVAQADRQAVLGVAHVLEIPPESLAKLSQLFADYEIIQPFEQLSRQVFGPAQLDDTLGETVHTGALLGLEDWRRGTAPGGDTATRLTHTLPDGSGVVLEITPGISLRAPLEVPEQRLEDITFFGPDGSGLLVEQVDPLLLSETTRQLRRLL